MSSPASVHPPVEDPRVEHARYWRFSGLPGTDLLTARFVTTAFVRHTHPTYTIGLITDGVEEFTHARGRARVGRGGLAVVGPEEVHTGHAGAPEGWSYRVFYPTPETVTAVARELGMRGTPSFTESGIDSPEAARALGRAHLAAEHGQVLAASSHAREGLALLLCSHGREHAPAPGRHTARAEVERAREILDSRLVDPPALEELAARVGMGPFALNRAFRAVHGLPPHAYLTQVRVDRARVLLRSGLRVSEVATETGFADQSHLTRHFKRRLGVPPGAYRRDMLAA
ncbi:AraC family transcriptional regulator [Nocardiopsis sp. CNT312]|uniref:AraC family transcriptional regulator n=1 Tax=Nocardiopsis sp. CNT312 TaxID=1137268 RepID=UPI0004916B1B|nr:AraC family transcriptional regulator [Nocardiopsis sp. CNT312]